MVAPPVQPDKFVSTAEILERLSTAPKLQRTFNSSTTAKCDHCRTNIESKSTIVQWEWLKFCRTNCFESFILKHNHGCVMCSKDCDFYFEHSAVASAHVYGNRLYLFCSNHCSTVFFDLAPFCQYCRRIFDPTMSTGFCHAICQQKFDALYATSSTAKQICCVECSLTTNASIRLSFGGSIYGFCSHRCYFYRTLVCALFPGIHGSRHVFDSKLFT